MFGQMTQGGTMKNAMKIATKDATKNVRSIHRGGRVIAGEFGGAKGPARTFTPINVFDLRLRARHRVNLDLLEGWTAAIFVLKGKVSVNGEAANEGELVVFEREGGEAVIEAASDATVFVMNGQPIDEPIAGYGPFVMNTQEQIRQAFVDYQNGRLGRIPTTTHRGET